MKSVVFVGLNGAAMPLALFAAGYANLPFVPLKYRLTDAELRRMLKRNVPAAVILEDDMVSRVAAAEDVHIYRRSEFERRFLSAAPGATEPAAETEQDITVLLFTSGTTGDPTAAVLRHSNLVNYVVATGEFLGADEQDASLVSVPPYHIAGISAILSGCYGGRRTVYLPQFSADDWVSAAARERIAHAMVVPTMLEQILTAMERQDDTLPVLRALSYGGGRMPESTILKAMRKLPPVAFVNSYGLTETSSTIALLDGKEHRAAFASLDPAVRRRLTSVGRALPSAELEIRDMEGRRCSPGEAGEIFIRGPQVSGEYLNGPAGIGDGWFATGDAGWLDKEQFLYIEGRLDDMIVRRGENIFPGEIEGSLRVHPAVKRRGGDRPSLRCLGRKGRGDRRCDSRASSRSDAVIRPCEIETPLDQDPGGLVLLGGASLFRNRKTAAPNSEGRARVIHRRASRAFAKDACGDATLAVLDRPSPDLSSRRGSASVIEFSGASPPCRQPVLSRASLKG